jgi:hypothetical protein
MVGTLKMNGTARTGAFTADGTQLLTSGGDGTGAALPLRTSSHAAGLLPKALQRRVALWVDGLC